jgi:pentatricopeptide repeat protein
MEDVFQSLVADPRVRVTGVHWAALINAYGCAAKDLDRALAVFESIAKHPSTARAREAQPDALAYEAVVGAIAANKRADLLPGFAAQIAASGVHMTAYVQNAFIRGFAAAGELDTARRMFEEMADPPSGVAAPNNHAPHVGEQPSKAVAVDGPVYREPSTWESMVRAELGAGERERAVALLERLKQRQYPDAVYNRISGILHSDDNVSPWPAQNAPAAS